MSGFRKLHGIGRGKTTQGHQDADARRALDSGKPEPEGVHGLLTRHDAIRFLDSVIESANHGAGGQPGHVGIPAASYDSFHSYYAVVHPALELSLEALAELSVILGLPPLQTPPGDRGLRDTFAETLAIQVRKLEFDGTTPPETIRETRALTDALSRARSAGEALEDLKALISASALELEGLRRSKREQFETVKARICQVDMQNRVRNCAKELRGLISAGKADPGSLAATFGMLGAYMGNKGDDARALWESMSVFRDDALLEEARLVAGGLPPAMLLETGFLLERMRIY